MADIIPTSDKDGVKLEEYNNVYSLVSYRNEYEQWAKYRVGKDKYADKDWPVKVSLGDRETAVRALKEIIAQVEDVPF
jgi:hypothetical protein